MPQLSIVNRSGEAISCHRDAEGGVSEIIQPSTTVAIQLPTLRLNLTLSPCVSDEKEKSTPVHDGWGSGLNGIVIGHSLTFGATWAVLKASEGSPWIIYRLKITREHHYLLILPRRDMTQYLSDIPDSVPLSSVTLPGTHDTMAFYGGSFAQCQSVDNPLAVQLSHGIRVLDIRLAVKKHRLMAYHGRYPQKASFQDILAVIHAFLTSEQGRRETIVISIKEEDPPNEGFSTLVHREILKGPGGKAMWYLDNTVPTLGQVRGKIVLFSRFGADAESWDGGDEGIGIHPTKWPDSVKEGFTWPCKNTTVRIHDWYRIPSFLYIPEKTELALSNMKPRPAEPQTPTLAISFFSASSFPFASPPTVARGFGWPQAGVGVEGVNGRLARRLIDLLSGDDEYSQKGDPRLRGWVLLDFYNDPDPALAPLLVEFNFLGRVKGEEGWS
ncbi:PLC-like phosphodiesterase [Irpex rosettiformis]|uniref:PLC-like phosphodiesterase n=1 Tax=Irpex rosettiformis TaxID=378272 RepID=A0ACB8TPR4_9APHY|nr:PLC-like phosphodiesterase [Irpex rosettiformis]